MSSEPDQDERRREERRRDERARRFWQSLRPERRLGGDRRSAAADVSTQQEPESRPTDADDGITRERRDALKQMLKNSEARQAHAARTRRPTLARGARVRVRSGPHVGEQGVILDADYIESRVRLRFDVDGIEASLDPDDEESNSVTHWIAFHDLGPLNAL